MCGIMHVYSLKSIYAYLFTDKNTVSLTLLEHVFPGNDLRNGATACGACFRISAASVSAIFHWFNPEDRVARSSSLLVILAGTHRFHDSHHISIVSQLFRASRPDGSTLVAPHCICTMVFRNQLELFVVQPSLLPSDEERLAGMDAKEIA